jgi:hypothetical protein
MLSELIYNSEDFCESLFSAFEIAENKILYKIPAHFFGANFRKESAFSTLCHLIISATTLNFLGDILIFFP